MRWRFLAASVWATEIDSTKPMTEIRSAGMKSAEIEVERKVGHRQRRQRLRHRAHDCHTADPQGRGPRPRRRDDDRTHGAGLLRDVCGLGFHAARDEERLQPLADPEQEPGRGDADEDRDRVRVAHMLVQGVEDLRQGMSVRLDAQGYA
jgi:hypothetical protein